MLYWKQKVSIPDIDNMSMRKFHGMYYIAYKKLSTEQGRKEMQGSNLEDGLKSLMGGL